jgi:hypothetical protein
MTRRKLAANNRQIVTRERLAEAAVRSRIKFGESAMLERYSVREKIHISKTWARIKTKSMLRYGGDHTPPSPGDNDEHITAPD